MARIKKIFPSDRRG